MKIVAISDTHIPIGADSLPVTLLKEIEKADLVVHAGDFVSFDIYSQLNSICKLKAVHGNMDSIEVRKKLPDKEVFSVGKFKVGLIHGWGGPSGLVKAIKKSFKDENPDLVIYGHSHCPHNAVFENVIFFNPGSPTDKNFAPYNSFGLIEIEDKIKCKIVKI